MSTNRESEYIGNKRRKWSQKKWYCIEIEELEEPSLECEIGESQRIRYVHHMEHPDSPKRLKAGCICAGDIEEDLSLAERRDDFLKSCDEKRKRCPNR